MGWQVDGRVDGQTGAHAIPTHMNRHSRAKKTPWLIPPALSRPTSRVRLRRRYILFWLICGYLLVEETRIDAWFDVFE